MWEALGSALSIALRLFDLFQKSPEAKAETLKFLERLLEDIEKFEHVLGKHKEGDTSELEDFFRNRRH